MGFICASGVEQICDGKTNIVGCKPNLKGISGVIKYSIDTN